MLNPVVPYLTQSRRFKPAVGGDITIELPGEKVRGKIKGVESDDAVVVEITGTPMIPHHGYRRGDIVPVRRGRGDHGIEAWQIVTEREMQNAEAIERFERDERIAAAQERAEAKRVEQAAAAATGAAEDKPAPETATTATTTATTTAANPAASGTQTTEAKRRVLGPRRTKIART